MRMNQEKYSKKTKIIALIAALILAYLVIHHLTKKPPMTIPLPVVAVQKPAL